MFSAAIGPPGAISGLRGIVGLCPALGPIMGGRWPRWAAMPASRPPAADDSAVMSVSGRIASRGAISGVGWRAIWGVVGGCWGAPNRGGMTPGGATAAPGGTKPGGPPDAGTATPPETQTAQVPIVATEARNY